MIRKEIDEGLLLTNDFISIFYQKVKDCLKSTSAGAATGTEECNGYSHRKFAEIFFFVQALYIRNLSANDLKKKDLPHFTTYYDETKPIVHSKIFMSMYFEETISELMKEIADYCDVQKIYTGKDKKLIFSKLDRFCVDLHIFNIVYDHIKSSDTAGLNQASFMVRLLSILQTPFTDSDLTKLKFALLNTGEIMDYISISPMHLDRYYNLFDTSKIDKDNDALKNLGTKRLDILTQNEIEIFGNYLYRMFGKLDYSIAEEPTAAAVQALLEVDIATFKEFLTYSNAANYNQFKTVFLFASPTQYIKIAKILSSDDKFLQVVLMNNFGSDDKNEKILMYVKSLDQNSFLDVNMYTSEELLKKQGYKDFYTKSIGTTSIKADIEKYKKQVRRVFYENNKKVEEKIEAGKRADNGDDLLHGPGKMSEDEIKKRISKRTVIEMGNKKRKEITESQVIQNNVVTEKRIEKRRFVVEFEGAFDLTGDEAVNMDDWARSIQEDLDSLMKKKQGLLKQVNIDMPNSSFQQISSRFSSKDGFTENERRSKSFDIHLKPKT